MKNSTILVFLLITIATISSTCVCNANTDKLCKESERQALLRFKEDLKDPMKNLSNWVGNRDCCSWTGVACDNSTGHVHELHVSSLNFNHYDLYYNDVSRYGLGGKINPSLLELKHLKHLDLSRNNFKGIQIPRFIGSIQSLIYLNLSYSGFGGIIPHQLGNLSSLRYLNFGNDFENDLKVENLQWISGLSSLQYLKMTGIDLNKALDWFLVINMLPSLEELHLSGCQLQNQFSPLSVINSTSSLVTLDLSYNFLGGLIPLWLFSLTNLEYLYLQSNIFNGPFPFGLTSLTQLKILDIGGNPFNSTIPPWMFGFKRLEYLDLSFTGLKGNIPSAIGNSTTSLVTLDLSSNYDLGPLMPMWLFNLTNLESLYLRSNNFKGTIPSGLTNLTHLKILVMSDNPFNSTIPPWICGFKRLEYLDLSWSHLKGNIPSSIGNLSSINTLLLSNNQLEGKLPNSLGSLCKLRELTLASNNFRGAVSEIFRRFSMCTNGALEVLYMGINHLSGQLTESLGKLSSLQDFDISHNQLRGSLLENVGQLVNLKSLHTSDNLLEGVLSENVGQIINLESLDISRNSLECVVSDVHFINLTRLKEFYAEKNSLTMKTSLHWLPPFQLERLNLNDWHLGQQLPHWIRWQEKLSELQISNTGISGTIPSWFCNFSLQLGYLNLSHNKFHGEFPCTNQSWSTIDLSFNQFNGLLPPVSSKIEIVDFSNNLFSGSIFHFFCDKKNFLGSGYVDLGNNLLFGKIPKCWTKWKNLEILNLQNNKLSGVIPSSMGYSTNLFWLQLRNNNLHGEFPLSLRNCMNLEALDLSENKFIGKIPKLIWISLGRLVVLNLHSNTFQGEIPLELCSLVNLQILDLSHNNFSGTIPRCFSNLSAMTTLENSYSPFLTFNSWIDNHDILVEVALVTKGREVEYSRGLVLVKSMDLSSNNLYGEIPLELTSLRLQTLNLSNNHLVGKIPSNIGDMRWLESLDLSKNHLSGTITPSISSLTFLSYLNLSYNNFTGPIPTSTQLQSFNESSFIGNHLCGPPLHQNCSVSDPAIPRGDKQGDDEDSLQKDGYLYLSLGLGFAFGFWGVLASLLFNVPWNMAFCLFLDRIVLRLYGAIF